MIGQDKNTHTIYKIFLYTLVVFLCSVFRVHAAVLSVGSAQQNIYVGDSVSIDYFIDTQDAPINVIDATLHYDAKTLSVHDISTGNSAASIWAEGPVVTEDGFIHFVAGFPDGITGNHISLLRVTYTAKTAGSSFLSNTIQNSHVYINNGAGTEQELSMQPVSFMILPEGGKVTTISSGTNPVQTTWYKDHDVKIHFTMQKDSFYSYSFSTNQELIPSDTPMQTNGDVLYEHIPDGVYYFKLAMKSGSGWSEAGVYRIQIDSTSPTILSAYISSDPSIYNGKSFVSFSGVDKTGGIAGYAVRSGYFGFYHNATSSYKINRPLFGNFITVRARDVAGNTSTQTIQYPAYVPNWLAVILLCALILGLLLRYTTLRRILKKIKK